MVLESSTLRFTVHRARDGAEVEIARGEASPTPPVILGADYFRRERWELRILAGFS